ncbi:hypothetical protein NDU88_004524 [Pleurodeles waltl]|uniref:Uncharacterized protein n=1 Tax=Pleurodeles waltl TaxID=8319 RepID=A0AAV7W991_PLEWA|nr:hypothetical protein NDU88_004524 [Pleurodeles waltl]
MPGYRPCGDEDCDGQKRLHKGLVDEEDCDGQKRSGIVPLALARIIRRETGLASPLSAFIEVDAPPKRRLVVVEAPPRPPFPDAGATGRRAGAWTAPKPSFTKVSDTDGRAGGAHNLPFKEASATKDRGRV